MTAKRLVGLTAVLSVLVAMIPVAMQGRVAEDDWQTLTTSVSTSNEVATVSQILFGQSVDRVQRIDGVLTTVLYPAGCANIDCALRDVAVMRGDQTKIVRGVPAVALEDERVLDSDGRVLWMEETDAAARFDAYELNVQTAEADLLARDVFVGDATAAYLSAAEGRLYIEAVGDTEVAPGMFPVTIRRGGINESLRDTTVMNVNWRKSDESIQDVSDDEKILTRYTFPNGHQELWLHERTVQRGTPSRPHSQAIAGTYTIGGHLVGAHFVNNDVIEFFRYQTLMRYTISTGTLEDIGERLYWVADLADQEQLVVTSHGTSYFIGQDDAGQKTVHVRNDGSTRVLGSHPGGDVKIDGQSVVTTSYSNVKTAGWYKLSQTVRSYDAHTGRVTVLVPGSVDVDVHGDTRVAIDTDGNVRWVRTVNGRTTVRDIGSADRAWLLSETKVITRGLDGRVYLITVHPDALVPSRRSETFYKLATSSTVYRVENGVRYAVPNEMTYFTWSDSFADVQTVSAATLDGLANGGYLQIKPGTMIKTATSKHVMVVQNDWYRQRLANEQVAQSLYGDAWWQGILVVEPDVMLQYQERQGPIDDATEYYQNL